MKKHILLLLFLLTCLSNQEIKAQFDPIKGCIVSTSTGGCIPNTVISAMPFLRIAPDARGGAMGDIGITTSPDVSSMHYNASKLAFVEDKFSLGLTYTPWLRGLNLNDVFLLYLSGYNKIDEVQTVGAALRYFSLGEINFTDAQGVSLGIGDPRELEFLISYARKLGDNFSAALSAKYVYSNLASGQSVNGIDIRSANAFAADISFTWRKDSKLGNYDSQWTFGLAFTNLGSKVSYRTDSDIRDFLPGNFGFGVGLQMDMDQYNSLTIAVEFNKLLVPSPISQYILVDGNEELNPEWDANNNGYADYREKSLFAGVFGSFGDAQGGFGEEMKELTFSIGAEYWYDRQFAFRLGYYYEHPEKGDRQFFTVGAGIKYNIFGINLSYLQPTSNQNHPLDSTLRFSLTFDMAGYNERNSIN